MPGGGIQVSVPDKPADIDQKAAVRRAARIASWMMTVKTADDPKEVLHALWPRLQTLAVEPARDEADFIERSAFQATAFAAQWAVRGLALKPNDVVPGWDEHFVALVRENSRASNALEKSRSVEGQLERKRLECALASQPLVLPPPETAIGNFGAGVPLAPVQSAPVQSTKYVGLKMSEVLTRFVATERSQGIDGRVESEVAPIVNFVVSLLDDPVMLNINGDHLLTIKREVAEIPLPKGFGQNERSLYFRFCSSETGDHRPMSRRTLDTASSLPPRTPHLTNASNCRECAPPRLWSEGIKWCAERNPDFLRTKPSSLHRFPEPQPT